MIKRYVKNTFRNILKRRQFSLAKVAGLAVGITCCFLIMSYVKQELSYDGFYSTADRIFRIGNTVIRPTHTDVSAASPTTLAPALKAEFPEIEYIKMLTVSYQAVKSAVSYPVDSLRYE